MVEGGQQEAQYVSLTRILHPSKRRATGHYNKLSTNPFDDADHSRGQV
jgi:hypothetical protein